MVRSALLEYAVAVIGVFAAVVLAAGPEFVEVLSHRLALS